MARHHAWAMDYYRLLFVVMVSIGVSCRSCLITAIFIPPFSFHPLNKKKGARKAASVGDFVIAFCGQQLSDESGGLLHAYEPLYIFEVDTVMTQVDYQRWCKTKAQVLDDDLFSLARAAFSEHATGEDRVAFDRANLNDLIQSGSVRYPFTSGGEILSDSALQDLPAMRAGVRRLSARRGGISACGC